jgi:prepilin-type N-terminal cleavage/methylation domain-containing protein
MDVARSSTNRITGAPPARRPPPRRGAAGMTLVELMITLVVGSIVSGAAFVFFVGQRRVYATQAKILSIQQNLWGAMDTLTRFSRSAGGGMIGCVRAGDPPPGGPVAPATGFRAYRRGPPEEVLRLAPLWIQNGSNGAPDKLTVVFGSGAFGTFSDANLAASVTSATDAIAAPAGQGAIFRASDFAILLDHTAAPQGPPVGDRGCTLFQVTSADAGTGALGHAGTSTWNPTSNIASFIPFPYVGGGTPRAGLRNIGVLNWVEFSIDATGAPEVAPRLVMRRLDGTTGPTTPMTLAEGIEDLQIAYACDTLPPPPAGDGVFTEGTDDGSKKTDEWIFNVAGDVPTADCNRPQALRITLVARSTEPDSTLDAVKTNAKPAVEDGAPGARDSFRHRVLTTTVFPRNR